MISLIFRRCTQATDLPYNAFLLPRTQSHVQLTSCTRGSLIERTDGFVPAHRQLLSPSTFLDDAAISMEVALRLLQQ